MGDAFANAPGGALGDVFTDAQWDYGRTYRPRMSAELAVPLAGTRSQRVAMASDEQVVKLPVRLHEVTVTRNDLNHADEAKMAVEFNDAPVDPRVLQSATGLVWIGQADASFGGDGIWQPRPADLQFAGVVTRVGRMLRNEEGWSVDIDLQDYTTLFIESAHYPREGFPPLTMPLSQAWAHICDHTGPLDDEGNVLSTVAVLRDRIVFQGEAKDIVIGSALPKRFAAMGASIYPIAAANAWTVWQQVVRAVGLVSYIHLDQCIVTTATDYFTSQNPPLFVLGRNVASLEETREIKFSGKGVAVLGFDPLTGTTIEGLYPPIGDKRVQRKRMGARVATTKRKKPPPSQEAVLASEARDVFNVPGVMDQAIADQVAQRIWEERSRQEIEGSFETFDMKVPLADGSRWIRTLDLKSGDTVHLEIQPAIEACSKIKDLAERQKRLRELGFSEAAAEIAARNLVDLGTLASTVYVKTFTATFVCPQGFDDGEVMMRVEFLNRYDPNAPATGDTDGSSDRNWLQLMKDPKAAQDAVARLSPDDAQSLLDNPDFLSAVQARIKSKTP